MNRKGQALVEFVLILPVFLMILFVVVDFGMIFSSKSNLESISGDVVSLIQNGYDVDDISNLYLDDDVYVSVSKSDNSDYCNIYLDKEVNLVTPFLKKIVDNPYSVVVRRVVYCD